MLNTDEQLARLKRQIALINHKFSSQPAKPKQPVPVASAGIHVSSARWFIEEWSEGQVVENDFGQHFQTERLFPPHKNHGSADVGSLADLPDNLLQVLGNGEIRSVPAQRWAFLDTETTGLAGGSGTYAFLIGVGRITREGFKVKQFFMREYAEERSILKALEAHLNDFDVLITYNGKSYDQPLLETRYLMTRHKAPFARLGHLDLLHGARRLWKLRLATCRLMQLEEQILGVYRDGDLPGELIPYVYFEYLRSLGSAAGLWEGIATYLRIISEYVQAYRGTGVPLSPVVTEAAKFGSDQVRFRRDFLRVSILPHSMNLYASELMTLLLKGELRNSFRLSLLPGLATAAALEQKITGSDKGIW